VVLALTIHRLNGSSPDKLAFFAFQIAMSSKERWNGTLFIIILIMP
jgi:hypothetical protein